MKKSLYVVTMYRWGDSERHSYVLGVYSTKTKAKKAGEKEIQYRGGKYYPECIEVPLDTDYGSGFKTIVQLAPHPHVARRPPTVDAEEIKKRGFPWLYGSRLKEHPNSICPYPRPSDGGERNEN